MPKYYLLSANPNSKTKEKGGTDNVLKKPGEPAINQGGGGGEGVRMIDINFIYS